MRSYRTFAHLGILIGMVCLATLIGCGQAAVPSPVATAATATTAPPTATLLAPTRTATLVSPAATATPVAVATATPVVPAATATPVLGATAAPAVATATTAPATTGDPGREVLAALRAQFAVPAFRVRSAVTTGGSTLETVIERVAPDRYRIVNAQLEAIVVGDKTYLKQAGQWFLIPADISGLLGSLADPDLLAETEATIRDVQFVGTEAVNGAPARVYTYNTTQNVTGTQAQSQLKLWVDVASGRPVRQEVIATLGGMRTTTVNVIEYDPTITIEAPLP